MDQQDQAGSIGSKGSNNSLKEKVILITGGSSGIGAGIAKHLAPLGVKLSLIGRNKESLENVLTLAADITIDAEVRQMLKTTVDTFGKLDVLQRCDNMIVLAGSKGGGFMVPRNLQINNAGIAHYKTLGDTNMERFDLMLKTNVRAPFYICQQAKPYLIESEGSVINISSILGQRGLTYATGYCVTKAALDHMTRIFAMEVAQHGIRVNSLSPGFTIGTEIQFRAGLSDLSFERHSKERESTIPLGRAGYTEDVAKVVRFLASDDAAFITGQVILVDGGISVATLPVA